MDLRNILNNLDRDEKAELAHLLHRELNVPDLRLVSRDIGNDRPVHCPHCEGSDIYGHGSYKGRRRYKCRSCRKTFNDFTGTAVDGIKKLEKFQEYLLLVVESVTIRKAAEKIGVNVKTIFDWRHKLLSSMEAFNGTGFSGIVECDDKQLDINDKGRRDLDRKAYKRPSDRDTKRGVSNDKVSVMVATDRNGGRTMLVAKVGRIDAESVQNTIGGFVAPDNILCSDSHPSIIKWARESGLEHHTFVASRQHVKDRCYHVQHVNSLDNRYERWVKGFYGVSTKYLQGYLNWFVFLQKVKKSALQGLELARCVARNIGAIKAYGSIERKYEELMIPHYSKT